MAWSGLALTTKDRVKPLAGVTTTAEDALLDQLIAGVSSDVEAFLGRRTLKQEWTEVYTLEPGATFIALRAYPVDTGEAFTVKASSTRDFSTATALTENAAYVLEPETGKLRVLAEFMGTRRGLTGRIVAPTFFEVVSTAGMGEDTAELVTLYPDLVQAVDQQVAYLYRRRHTLGGNVVVGGGQTQFTDQYGLLKDVVRALSKYRRRYYR